MTFSLQLDYICFTLCSFADYESYDKTFNGYLKQSVPYLLDKTEIV